MTSSTFLYKPVFMRKSTILANQDIRTNLEIQRFFREHEQQADRHVSPDGDAAQSLRMRVRFITNFELHRRKIFWVEETLAYMLASTTPRGQHRLMAAARSPGISAMFER